MAAGRTWAFVKSKVGAMEGSEQKRDGPNSVLIGTLWPL